MSMLHSYIDEEVKVTLHWRTVHLRFLAHAPVAEKLCYKRKNTKLWVCLYSNTSACPLLGACVKKHGIYSETTSLCNVVERNLNISVSWSTNVNFFGEGDILGCPD